MECVDYAELHAHCAFSFLDGASQPEEMAAEAGRLGLSAMALTDHDGLYGVVRFANAARAVGLPDGVRRGTAPARPRRQGGRARAGRAHGHPRPARHPPGGARARGERLRQAVPHHRHGAPGRRRERAGPLHARGHRRGGRGRVSGAHGLPQGIRAERARRNRRARGGARAHAQGSDAGGLGRGARRAGQAHGAVRARGGRRRDHRHGPAVRLRDQRRPRRPRLRRRTAARRDHQRPLRDASRRRPRLRARRGARALVSGRHGRLAAGKPRRAPAQRGGDAVEASAPPAGRDHGVPAGGGVPPSTCTSWRRTCRRIRCPRVTPRPVVAARAHVSRRARAVRPARQGADSRRVEADRARAHRDRGARLPRLLPDRSRHRELLPARRTSCARDGGVPPTPPSASRWG